MHDLNLVEPIVSFSFDDFPRSALHVAGPILKEYGCKGTYYASAGLMGKLEPPGEIFWREDLEALLREGHELGCHTFHHYDAMLTLPGRFEASVIANRKAFAEMCPGVELRSFSYPREDPNIGTKRAAGRHSLSCRAGGQTLNRRRMDMNSMRAFFIEQSRDDPDAIWRLIEQNREERGWLIFATHDVCDDPTRYGCTPGLFEEVVRRSVESGARILTVGQACDVVLAA
jgi:peptidoglycan/xylan/chitin deacetylase (PgdA/CDA1 family)